ncbi:MAG: diphosphomevalonate decarboxylase [Nanoarchaeota archaeon]
MKATAIANSNIAFVKYWGKKAEGNIPMNASISMTLDSVLSTKTTVEFSPKYDKDEFILNDKKETGEKLERVSKFLDIFRCGSNAKIVSVNTFPTASGIASSASGFAALAAACNKSMELNMTDTQLSALARKGSGSASRSIYSGFVEWSGESAKQLQDEVYWEELRDIVVIVSSGEKKISSRDAMKLTQDKSKLYKERIKNIDKTLEIVRKAISRKDISVLAESIMKESDNMHACIEEIGIKYLNETSHAIKEIITNLNSNGIIAAYTFDAGPNAHIITTKKNLPKIKDALFAFGRLIVSKPGKGVRYSEEHLF